MIKDTLNNFIDNILAKEKFYSTVGIIEEVSESTKTCTVQLITGEAINDVRLETDLSVDAEGNLVPKAVSGLTVIPALGSQVIISFLSTSDAFISLFSAIDKIYSKQSTFTFNDGSLGGLINIQIITDKLNGLVDELQTELTKIQTGITGAGGAYTPGTLTDFDKDDYEDITIKH